MNQKELKNVLEQHKLWLEDNTKGKRADFSNADLMNTDFDYSAFPLWCGTKDMKVDIKLIYQLLAHICALDCDHEDHLQVMAAIQEYALKSHRAADLGLDK